MPINMRNTISFEGEKVLEKIDQDNKIFLFQKKETFSFTNDKTDNDRQTVPNIPLVINKKPEEKFENPFQKLEVVKEVQEKVETTSIPQNSNVLLDQIRQGVQLKKVVAVEKIQEKVDKNVQIPKETASMHRNSNFLLDQIRQGVQLKKVVAVEKKPIKINKVDQNYMETSLSQAVKQRYANLNKNNAQSDDEENEWSD